MAKVETNPGCVVSDQRKKYPLVQIMSQTFIELLGDREYLHQRLGEMSATASRRRTSNSQLSRVTAVLS